MIDLRSGQQIAHLDFKSDVDEIFDVQVLCGTRCPFVSGPMADAEEQKPIWVVPNPQA